MDKQKIQQYTARITQANRTELTVIVFELATEHIESAQEAYQSGDAAALEENAKKAMRYVTELSSALNYSQVISYDLFQLYRYVKSQLAKVAAGRKPDGLEEAKRVLCGLKSAFEEVAKQDDSAPLMSNTQQLYAGLTYGKGTLNEVFINENEANRGYKV